MADNFVLNIVSTPAPTKKKKGSNNSKNNYKKQQNRKYNNIKGGNNNKSRNGEENGIRRGLSFGQQKKNNDNEMEISKGDDVNHNKMDSNGSGLKREMRIIEKDQQQSEQRKTFGMNKNVISKNLNLNGNDKDNFQSNIKSNNININKNNNQSNSSNISNGNNSNNVKQFQQTQYTFQDRQKRKRNEEDKAGVKKVKQNPSNEKVNRGNEKKVGRLSSLFSGIKKDGEVQEEYEENIQTNFEPSNAVDFKEKKNFQDFGIADSISKSLKENLNIEKPTEIQKKAIPVILQSNDVLIKSQTGSGKTLAFLLPILDKIQRFDTKIDRSFGTIALIITPTRELALQTHNVVVKLLKYMHYIVPGYVIGGEKKKSEKNRLRQGVNILVATPGRLLDHLEHTQSFDVSKVAFVVLDEADHLIELNYEKEIIQILDTIAQRSKISEYPFLSSRKKHQTLLCSATLDKGVKSLITKSLHNPVFVESEKDAEDLYMSGDESDFELEALLDTEEKKEVKLSAPTQLHQKYVVTPTKQRLVLLLALLKKLTQNSNSSKGVIFFSTCDSVDFHYRIFTSNHSKDEETQDSEDEDGDEDEDEIEERKKNKKNRKDRKDKKDKKDNSEKIEDINKKLAETRGKLGGILPAVQFFHLHGEIRQILRTKTFENFIKAPNGILLTTDIASRGLDLPKVNWVIQFDPPSDLKEYIHRIGRTARIGTKGQSIIFLLQNELGFLQRLKEHEVTPELLSTEQAFEGFGKNWQNTLQELQNDIEFFVLNDKTMRRLARNAFQAFVRSYLTRSKKDKEIFSIKKVHLGHLAKSFALRDAPSKFQSLQPKKGPPTKKKFNNNNRRPDRK